MFEDRYDAAMQLVPKLKKYANQPNTIVLAVPRGGLQLGSVLARELHLPLDIILSKKIGYPGNPEYAIGAASLDSVIISPEFTGPEFKDYIQQETNKIRTLLQTRAAVYRAGMPPQDFVGKTVIVVDDGVATGSTLRATLELLAHAKTHKIVVALPVAPPTALTKISAQADEVVCLVAPEVFFGVGQFYHNFAQVDDTEAIELLHEANA